METLLANDSTGVGLQADVVRRRARPATWTTSPVRAGSGGGTLKTPGRTVAIWVGRVLGHDRGHDVAAEGRPRLLEDRRPGSWLPLLKSPISRRVQSAVRPEPAGVGDPRGELAAQRAGPEEHHLRLALADEVGDRLLVDERVERAEERVLDDVDDVGAGGDQLGRPIAGVVAGEDRADPLAQAVGELADLAQELERDGADAVALALGEDPELAAVGGLLAAERRSRPRRRPRRPGAACW